MAPISCPSCGVKLPQRVARCPACHVRLGHPRIAIALAGAIAVIILAGMALQVRRLGGSSSSTLRVEIAPATPQLAPDARGTDVSTTIENPNAVPIDVTILVRGLDMSGRAVVEKSVGPLRYLRPGQSRDIDVHLDATPLVSVEFETTAVTPADPDH